MTKTILTVFFSETRCMYMLLMIFEFAYATDSPLRISGMQDLCLLAQYSKLGQF